MNDWSLNIPDLNADLPPSLLVDESSSSNSTNWKSKVLNILHLSDLHVQQNYQVKSNDSNKEKNIFTIISLALKTINSASHIINKI